MIVVEEIKYQYRNYMDTATRGDKIRLWLFIGMAVTLVGTIWVAFPIKYQLAQGSEGKGLIVYLTVNTNFPQQSIDINTYQYDDFVAAFEDFMYTGTQEYKLVFDKHEISNGEFELCVYTPTDEYESCTIAYDGKEKEPVYATIDIFTEDPNAQINIGDSQAQSQASNNENNNANSNSLSQETNIYICNDGECKKQ